METPSILSAIILTAVLASILSGIMTSISLYLYLKYLQRTRLNAALDEYTDIIRQRLKEGIEQAGRDLLPQFKEEVRKGFKEGLSDVLRGELIDQTARSIARSSADIVESGFNLLKGAWPKPDDSQSGP